MPRKIHKELSINTQQWLFLAPRSNETSRANFMATLSSGYPIGEIEKFLTEEEKSILSPRQNLYIWGNTRGKLGSWNKMKVGDLVAFYAKGNFVYVGKCILKKHSSEIARQLWGNAAKKDYTWEYVYFLDELRSIFIPLNIIRELNGYKEKMVVQGFTPFREEGVKNIMNRYGSLTAFFDNYTTGLKSKDFSVLEDVSSKKDLDIKDIIEIDEVTRGKDLDILLKEWEQRKSSEAPATIERKVNLIKRNVTLVGHLKERYKNRCQVCGFTFKQKNGKFYSEVAHIEPISSKKAGVDSPSNMLVLCPNHHKMLDLGNLKIISNTQYEIEEEIKDLLEPVFNK